VYMYTVTVHSCFGPRPEFKPQHFLAAISPLQPRLGIQQAHVAVISLNHKSVI
jgi:hypothetical protein